MLARMSPMSIHEMLSTIRSIVIRASCSAGGKSCQPSSATRSTRTPSSRSQCEVDQDIPAHRKGREEAFKLLVRRVGPVVDTEILESCAHVLLVQSIDEPTQRRKRTAVISRIDVTTDEHRAVEHPRHIDRDTCFDGQFTAQIPHLVARPETKRKGLRSAVRPVGLVVQIADRVGTGLLGFGRCAPIAWPTRASTGRRDPTRPSHPVQRP